MNASSVRWVRLGDYIERSMVNNSDLKYGPELIEGVNSDGVFCKSRANTIDINLKPYKIVNNGDFVYNPSRLNLGSLAYRTTGMCIVSHLYVVFRLNELGKRYFLPDFLYMYFKRDEFLRLVTFLNLGSQRPEFNFFDMSEIRVPMPSLKIQHEIVATYNGMKDLAEQNESLITPLSKTCEAFILECKNKYGTHRLGDFIKEVSCRNTENKYSVESLRGVTNEGIFDTSKANTIDLNFTNYKIVAKNQFAYNPARINIGSIAINQDTEVIISPMYVVFEVTSKDDGKYVILPEFLNIWFRRKEFQRSTRFYATGSVRDIFDFNLMKETQVPMPPLEIQHSIVNLYYCLEEAKSIASSARDQLKALCSTLVQKAINS